ncbi:MULTISPECIES: glycosyltransferase [unclassified Luteibacter]|uniref:glycosyltransferase n=1 Tax=Luteibacter sp. PvP019 TaxID=3156436 RepID=UPI003394AE59
MSNILIVLPFSGRTFGGGLAVFNQEFTRALLASRTGERPRHSVKLLTLNLTDASRPPPAESINPTSENHGGAEIIFLNDAPTNLVNPRGIDSEREGLYAWINDPAKLLAKADILATKIGGKDKSWVPDIIIGHSRFSGPAAILLKQQLFRTAKVNYFLHSYPVEGTVLTGYNAYHEQIDTASAARKIAMEAEWMKKADVVVPVGPFLRAGALKLLGGAKVRVHECIGGTDGKEAQATFNDPGRDGRRKILFNGRANAPIKGLEDILLAAQTLRDDPACPPIDISVRFWESKDFYPPAQDAPRTAGTHVVDVAYVQEFANAIVGRQGTSDKITVTIGAATKEIMNEVRASHGVLMPSYIEHFGLVPIEALGVNVPVLVNEVSGSGMFLADAHRFGTAGGHCVVADFHKRVSPSVPDDFLDPARVPSRAFDARPTAWAAAIKALVLNLPNRFAEAKTLGNTLRENYTWTHCAEGVVNANRVGYATSAITQQGPQGVVWDPTGNTIPT